MAWQGPGALSEEARLALRLDAFAASIGQRGYLLLPCGLTAAIVAQFSPGGQTHFGLTTYSPQILLYTDKTLREHTEETTRWFEALKARQW